MRRPLSLFAGFLLVLAHSATVIAGEAKTVRLLTIGNSFSRNATNPLGALAKAGGHTLIHTSIVVGGASMELHSEKAIKNAQDPKDKAGLYTNGRSLVQELQDKKWDYVTIQQASIKSHDLSTYQPHAGRLAALIHQHAPGAHLLVHETWAYRVDDARFTKPPTKPGGPKTQAEMYQGLKAAYTTIAKELNAGIIPVGDAFYAADTDSAWGYQPDPAFTPKGIVYPAVPNQKHSLHIGWRWKAGPNGKQAFGMDAHHANAAGEYLGACVWYEVLFGESSVGNTYQPKGLEPEYVRFLQETAHKAVQQISQPKGSAATQVQALERLVAFWDFQEEAGQLRVSEGPAPLKLQEKKGPVKTAAEGVFGPRSAEIQRGQWLMIPRAETGALDIHGKAAEVTVVAWIKRKGKDSWQAIAGVWDETRKKRQYCLFLNAPRGTREDEMKRYPLANRIHGHVSAVGGPTPGEEFCITYSSGATEIPLDQWTCIAMQYDGQESRVYVNGKLDSLEHYNPFRYADGLFDGGADGADFTVGAVHRGGSWGNFFDGLIGGLAVYDRALSVTELQTLASLLPSS